MVYDTMAISEGFPKTEWPLVNAAGQADTRAKEAALELVLVRYLPVLKAHVALQYRVSEDQAAEWLQSFVVKKVLEKNILAMADQDRGKFRTFLLRSLHNFIIQQLRYDQAAKRSTKGETILVDDLSDHDLAGLAVQHADGFDVAWAKGILVETIQRMEKQCQETGRPEVWGVFECRLLKPLFEDTEPMPYDQLIEKFGLESPAQASNILITAKRMFGRFLRSVVAEYARNEQEVEEEINELKSILFRS